MAKPIHEQIREARETAEMTQAELAKACGFYDQSAVARIEAGNHPPTTVTLQKVADATGVPITIFPAKPRRLAKSAGS